VQVNEFPLSVRDCFMVVNSASGNRAIGLIVSVPIRPFVSSLYIPVLSSDGVLIYFQSISVGLQFPSPHSSPMHLRPTFSTLQHFLLLQISRRNDEMKRLIGNLTGSCGCYQPAAAAHVLWAIHPFSDALRQPCRQQL